MRHVDSEGVSFGSGRSACEHNKDACRRGYISNETDSKASMTNNHNLSAGCEARTAVASVGFRGVPIRKIATVVDRTGMTFEHQTSLQLS
eukprot:1709744-Rhodomonas_salina.1